MEFLLWWKGFPGNSTGVGIVRGELHGHGHKGGKVVPSKMHLLSSLNLVARGAGFVFHLAHQHEKPHGSAKESHYAG